MSDDGAPWTRERYARLLRATYAIVQPLEPLLDARLGVIFASPPPRSRAQRLERDLHALGVVAETFPSGLIAESDAAAFGTAYVLQGSLLGGAVISRQLRHDFEAGLSFDYFSMYGKDLGAAWSAFCASLNAFGEQASAGERAVAVSAALDAFSAFDAAIDRFTADPVSGFVPGAVPELP